MTSKEIDLELTGVIATHDVPPGFASWRSYVLGRGHDIVKALRAPTPTPASSVLVGEAEQIDHMSLGKHQFGQSICELINRAEILREDGHLQESNHHEAAALYLYRAPAAPLSLLGSGDAEKVSAIRRRLAAAPGLPWSVNEKEQQIWSAGTEQYIGTDGTMSDPEIAFIVNASEDMKFLLSLVSAAASTGGGAGDEQAEIEELRRKLALVDMPTATIIEANSSMYADQLRMRKQLDAAAVVQWVPVEERTGRDTYEWVFVRLTDGRVESAIFIDDDIDNPAWCQWDESSYEVMPVQPSHFMPKPNGDLPAAAPQHLVVEGAAAGQPWCARCPATEKDVNSPGFRCAECDSLLGISHEAR